MCLINQKLTHPLVVSSMSNKQLQSTPSIIRPPIITSKIFDRKWPEGLRYDNHKYCGLELLDYSVEQRLRKIQLIHKILLYPKYKIVMQGIIEWYQLSAGLTGQILANPSINVNYLNSKLGDFCMSLQCIFSSTGMSIVCKDKFLLSDVK